MANTYTIDYIQELDGRWSAGVRNYRGNRHTERTRSRLLIDDCVADVYDALPADAVLEVGDVREQPEHGLFPVSCGDA